MMPPWLDEFARTLTQWMVVPWVVAVVGGWWALLTFSRDARAKAAEILLKVEENYRACLKTLLELEHVDTYDAVYAPAIREFVGALAGKERDRARAALGAERVQPEVERALTDLLRDEGGRYVRLIPSQGAAIDAMEAVFRHFFMCYHIRRLGVGRRSMDDLCSYYLQVFWTRPEVRMYLAVYWPSLYFWAQSAGQSFPRRTFGRVARFGPHIRTWWTGTSRPVAVLDQRPAVAQPPPYEVRPDVASAPEASK